MCCVLYLVACSFVEYLSVKLLHVLIFSLQYFVVGLENKGSLSAFIEPFFLVLESDWLIGVRYSSDIEPSTVSPFGSLHFHYNFKNNAVFVSQNVVLRVFLESVFV